MRDLSITVVYLGFFGVIGFGVYYTNDVLPLFALFGLPLLRFRG